ncbi:transcriptional regulator, LysR family [Aliiroseovarius halocynthiae]|uniref:LysR family transcriptional regulator n=1 Tax=Aliiroseovarius halocynthiae TaxID=985055 RepID=A0A545SWL1_9RHOB|nr:LysR family transcriptional regulator [Aliiroseovarius halocynthiae]TQV69362.1 LysR family transcriptional regulator [Aliiroseovarius halocynthiae]SMR72539.1 transcriptional regulator, LysR family [Aliiroseovarius halocynthiae]
MNEKAINWNDLSLFLAVARAGGLSPAAAATGKSAATLGRRMLALERDIGQDLFIRHDRGYSLTQDGQALLNRLKDVEVSLSDLGPNSVGNALPTVKISAGTWMTLFLLHHMTYVAGPAYDTPLRFVSTEKTLDLPHREITIGFRSKRPTQHNLAARKFQRVDFAPYAISGAPDIWIKTLTTTASSRWLQQHVGDNASCEVSHPRNSLDLALSGHGIALLPTFIGKLYPELLCVGDTIEELSNDQWIVTHQDDRHLPEVRRIIDRLHQLPKTGRQG